MKKIKSLFMLLVVCLAVSGIFKYNLNVEAAENIQEIEIPYSDYNKIFEATDNETFSFENESENSVLLKFQVEQNDYLKFYGNVKAIYDSNNEKLREFNSNLYSFGGYVFDKGSYYLEVSPGKLREHVQRDGKVRRNLISSDVSIERYNLLNIIKGKIKKNKNSFVYYNYAAYIDNVDEGRYVSTGDMSITKDNGVKCSYGGLYFTSFTYEHISEGKQTISYDFSCKDRKSNMKFTGEKDFKKILNGEKPQFNKKELKDTKKPTVKGVKNNKTYKKKVKFKVSDKSGIKKVTLNNKKIKVSKAKKGYTVKKKGKYTLIVWDKVGNKRVVKFRIK